MLNTIRQYAEKLRTWGIKGVFDYLRASTARSHIVSAFEDNARKFPTETIPGITVIGQFNDTTSLSKVLRDFIIKLHKSNIPFQTYNTSTTNTLIQREINDLLTPVEQFRALKYSTVIGHFPPTLLQFHKNIKKIQIVFWEFESGLFECDQSLLAHSSLGGMSDFVIKSIRRQLTKPIEVELLPYPFLMPEFPLAPRNQVRTKYGIDDTSFVVFYNFSLGSSYSRKNPDGTIHAFAEAFNEKDDAILLLKINGASSHPDELQKIKMLASELNIDRKLIIITDYLSTADIYSITSACDCYISLHRGEGFGLGIAESMSLGVPAIVTNYSAPTEFCNSDNSICIPYKLIRVRSDEIDNLCYRFVKEWADPSIRDAATALKKFYEDREFRQRLGENARETIAAQFSLKNFADRISKII